VSRTVTASQIETLNHALAGFAWLKKNHEAIVNSATVEIEGEDFKVERDYNLLSEDTDDDGNAEFGVLVVEFG
jgi:hypothetical protein